MLSRPVDAGVPLSESVIRSLPSAIALLRGPDFVIEMVNPAFQELSPGEPMVGRTVAEVWPEAAPLVIPLLRAVRDGGIAYGATGQAVPSRRGSGALAEVRYFDFSYVPLTQGGEVLIDSDAGRQSMLTDTEGNFRCRVPEGMALFGRLTADEYLRFVGRMYGLDRATTLNRTRVPSSGAGSSV